MTNRRQEVKNMSAELKSVLDEFCKKYDVSLTVKGGRYDDNEVKFPLVFIKNSEKGEIISPSLKALRESHCSSYEDKEFTCMGEIYSLVGFRPRATKNKYVGKNKSGKCYVFPYSAVESMFKAA